MSLLGIGAGRRVEGSGGLDFASCRTEAFGEEDWTSCMLQEGGDHKEEVGREAGERKGARKECTEAVRRIAPASDMLAAALCL